MWTGSQYTSEIPSFPSQRLPSGFTASFVYPSCTWEILSLTKLKLVTLQNITIFFFFFTKTLQILGVTEPTKNSCHFYMLWLLLIFFSQWKFLAFEVQIRTLQELGPPGSNGQGLDCIYDLMKRKLWETVYSLFLSCPSYIWALLKMSSK